MNKKTVAFVSLLVVLGITCVTLGAIMLASNIKDKAQAKKFHYLIVASKDAVDEARYQDLPQILSSWQEIKNFKSSYNQGWINLKMFEGTGDINAYRAARANLRESLRQEPEFFDAKHNLAYLDNLALKRGVDPNEIPLFADTQPDAPPKGSDTSFNPIKGGKISQDDLRNKITKPLAPGLGGEPLDLDAVPDVDEKNDPPTQSVY